MKIKTSELTGAALDWAVAKCEGHPKAIDSSGLDGPLVMCGFVQVHLYSERKGQEWVAYLPTSNWAQGGPIIEREEIDTYCHESPKSGCGWWVAEITGTQAKGKGSTPLIAAMRCLVCAKLGDEIDIPEELV